MESTVDSGWVIHDGNVKVSHLGIGYRGKTWYGSPDAVLREHIPGSDVPVVASGEDASEKLEFDGCSNLELKKTIKGDRYCCWIIYREKRAPRCRLSSPMYSSEL